MKIRENFKIAKDKIYYFGLNYFYKIPFMNVKKSPQNEKKDKDRIKNSKKKAQMTKFTILV